MPTPLFCMLTHGEATEANVRGWVQAVDDGLWAFDPQERDPRTGWGWVQAAVRQRVRRTTPDRAMGLILGLAARRGAPFHEAAEDGLTALEWARAQQAGDLAHHLETLGGRAPNVLSNVQEELLRRLCSWTDSMADATQVVSSIAKEWGDVDAAHQGVPLALFSTLAEIHINGGTTIPLSSHPTATELKAADWAFKRWSGLGEAALKHSPRSSMPLWCWLNMANAWSWLPDGLQASTTRKNQWLAQWQGLEQRLLRAWRRPGHSPDQAREDLALAVADAIVGLVQAVRPDTVLHTKLQPLVAYCWMGLSEWLNRLPRPAQAGVSPEEAVLLTLIARTTDAVPAERFDLPSFAMGWHSALYYAAVPTLNRLLAHPGSPDLSAVRAWASFAPLLDAPARPDQRERLSQWLAQAQTPPDPALAKITTFVGHAKPAVAAQLRGMLSQSRLDAVLPEIAAAPPRSPRM